MKTSTRLAVGAAALLLLAACCRALTVEEAVQTINKASWDFYGSSLPDCNGELITSMMYAQARIACDTASIEMSDGQLSACTSSCQTSECQAAANCVLAAVPLSYTTCPDECKSVISGIGMTCAKAMYTRQMQDSAAWALALATGQQLPPEADNLLRSMRDTLMQMAATGGRRLLQVTGSGGWDTLSVSDKIAMLFTDASYAARYMAVCVQ